MTTCDDIEVAIEMRNHGALPRSENDALTLHLKDCDGCRSFEALSTATENTMATYAQHYVESANWDALFATTHRVIQRNTRDQIARGAFALFIATLGLMLMSAHPMKVAAIEAAAGTAVFTLVWLVSKRRRAALAGIKETGELLFQHRFELETRLRATRRVLALPILLPFIYLELQSILNSTRSWVGFGLLAAALVAQTGFVFFVRRPQLQRELNELTAHRNR